MIDSNRSCLVFVESRDAQEGFRSGEGTDDEIVVRELIQNALDAGADKIDFRSIRIPITQVPDIDGYREAVGAIHTDLKKTPVARAALERIRKVLEAEIVNVLLCTDNGSGLRLNEYQRLLAEAMSAKVDDAGTGKLGSVGVGHMTALDASNLRYVLYASRGPEGPLFGGQAVLASQLLKIDGREMLRVRRGCLTTAEHVDDFRGWDASPANPMDTPEWLSVPPAQGTTVAILAYGSLDEEVASDEDTDLISDPHMDRIFDAVAKNFMVALRQKRMNVTYSSEIRSDVVLDEQEIRRRLYANRDRRRASRRGYSSGARAWAAWETLTEGETLPCEGGSLWYRLTPGKTSTVVVFRNGMRITDDAPRLKSYDFKGVNAFSAVLDAESNLADAIKECETDSHLEIKISQAPGDSGELVKRELQAVQDVIKRAAGELQTDQWIPDVLRIFDAKNVPSRVETAPPRHRPLVPDSPQQPLPQPDSEPGSAPPGPAPGLGPSTPTGDSPRPVRPRAWRPGNVQGVRRTLVPLNEKEVVIEWDFTGETRMPPAVGVAVVVGSGSQPSDRSPEPDSALQIRLSGDDDGEWAEELRVPADRRTISVEVRGAPSGWEAVTSVVSRRA